MEERCYTSLHLIYPPVSDQEATWIERDADVEAIIRNSDIYFIGARYEAAFANLEAAVAPAAIKFDVLLGDSFVDRVVLDPYALAPIAGREVGDIDVDFGEKIVRIWDAARGRTEEGLLDWFTTEKLIWERSRSMPGISGLDNYRKFLTYELLYVGIAKVGDTFTRLFKNAHKKRQQILSNELQRRPGARVSDEIYLFVFGLDALRTSYYDPAVHSEIQIPVSIDPKTFTADAEKAFVSLLTPGYNETKFRRYPAGKDGLASTGLAGYQYAIAENMSFATPRRVLRGGRDNYASEPSPDADFIVVDGDEVTVVTGRRI